MSSAEGALRLRGGGDDADGGCVPLRLSRRPSAGDDAAGDASSVLSVLRDRSRRCLELAYKVRTGPGPCDAESRVRCKVVHGAAGRTG